MKKLLPILLLCSGCNTYYSEQTQTDKLGVTTKTVVRIKNVWDSKTELAKLRTTQTDKSQGIGIGHYAAESSGTNAVLAIEGVINAAVTAAIKATIKP